MAKKVVIKVNNNHFIAQANEEFVIGCNHVKDALDVSDWTFEQLQYVMSNLHNVGHKNAKVIEVNA